MKKLNNVGIFLRKLRIEHGLNQAEMANLLKMGVASYSSVENGRVGMSSSMREIVVNNIKLSDSLIVEMEKAINQDAAIKAHDSE